MTSPYRQTVISNSDSPVCNADFLLKCEVYKAKRRLAVVDSSGYNDRYKFKQDKIEIQHRIENHWWWGINMSLEKMFSSFSKLLQTLFQSLRCHVFVDTAGNSVAVCVDRWGRSEGRYKERSFLVHLCAPQIEYDQQTQVHCSEDKLLYMGHLLYPLS